MPVISQFLPPLAKCEARRFLYYGVPLSFMCYFFYLLVECNEATGNYRAHFSTYCFLTFFLTVRNAKKCSFYQLESSPNLNFNFFLNNIFHGWSLFSGTSEKMYVLRIWDICKTSLHCFLLKFSILENRAVVLLLRKNSNYWYHYYFMSFLSPGKFAGQTKLTYHCSNVNY